MFGDSPSGQAGSNPNCSTTARNGNGCITPKIQNGLTLLWEAYHYARDVTRTPWDFALEIGDLRAVGLTLSDFRWLVCKGWVEHAQELTRPGDARRRFRLDGGLMFTPHTCFVLTAAGALVAETLRVAPVPRRDVLSRVVDSPWPHWDTARRTLFVGEQVVKQYRVPCTNQEAILAAFEEEGWPPRINDPLPPHEDQDPKRRLHDTIKSLNLRQKAPLLRFHGDGTGEGVSWAMQQEQG